MAKVLGPRSWIFWWAVLTATVFLKGAVSWLMGVFRDTTVFRTNVPPFNLLPSLNSLIDAAATWMQNSIKFKPNDILIAVGSFSVPNWIFAVLAAVVFLGVAAVVYSKALATSSILDDIGALILLYFVIRVEAHLFALTSLPILSPGAKSLIGNDVVVFIILLLFLLGLTITGEGLQVARSFWRGLIEFLVVALLLFPKEVASATVNGLNALIQFASLLQSNLTIAGAWALVGLALAGTRLYHADVREVPDLPAPKAKAPPKAPPKPKAATASKDAGAKSLS